MGKWLPNENGHTAPRSLENRFVKYKSLVKEVKREKKLQPGSPSPQHPTMSFKKPPLKLQDSFTLSKTILCDVAKTHPERKR